MSEEITAEWCAKTFESVKNWGRWGADDQLGTINLITPARRKRAAALVQDGVPLQHTTGSPVNPIALF